MGVFDTYIAVDWSAANTPKTGKDSIWISERAASGWASPSLNPATRAEAMRHLEARIAQALATNERVFIGFDFPFGYPEGAAGRIGGTPTWQALWNALDELVTDDDNNASNRFDVASELNRRLSQTQRHFWGHPPGRDYGYLGPKKDRSAYGVIAEKRLVEKRTKSAQPVWKLSGVGCVGSQALLGIPRLNRLRARFGGQMAIWPFETDFERDLSRPVLIAEIYPSLVPIDPTIEPKDRGQVEAFTAMLQKLDHLGELSNLLAAPETLSEPERVAVVEQEGWIVGVEKPALVERAVSTAMAVSPDASKLAYLRDPDEIYRRSFAIVQAEADLARFSPEEARVAERMIHACGQVEIAKDLVFSSGAVTAGVQALAGGKPLVCDAEMVASGIIARLLPAQNSVICTLNHKGVAEAAKRDGTTRSAAAVDLWDNELAGAVVVIGNAPTALFRLMEKLDEGAPKPALIVGLPVGFVGAAESKAEFAADPRGVPFITLSGRIGGSALAAAAINALAGLAGK